MTPPSRRRFDAYLRELGAELRVRLGRTAGPAAIRQILTETRAHLDDSYRDLVATGASEEEATRRAVGRFGAPKVVASAYRGIALESRHGRSALAPESRHGAGGLRRPPGGPWGIDAIMSALLRDLRIAVRGLLRAPGYTLAFVLTLGLGLGANTAIFSVVNGVLLKPLPHRDGDRLVYLRHSARGAGVDNALFSVPEIAAYRDQVESFTDVAEFSALTFTMLGVDEPRRVRAGIVTGNYFDVMGLMADAGRVIVLQDDSPTADAVSVLTHEYWQRAFGGDRDIVGTVVRMNGRSVRIVGVVEPSPPYPERTDLFVNLAASPHHLDAAMTHDRRHRMTEAFARLDGGVSLPDARAQVDRVTARIHAEFPEIYDEAQGFTVAISALRDQLAARARPTFLLLLGAAALVLVIACANVANLTLSRMLRRRDELAVRASLGAGRGALRRQLLIENLVPGLLGAALGLLLARLGLIALVEYAARYTARASEISIDTTVFLVAFAVGIGAACFFALIPRLPASLSGSRVTAGLAGRRLQRVLVVGQVAVCFVLLIGAGLLLRTLINLHHADGGLSTEGVLTMSIPSNTPAEGDSGPADFYESVLERVGALPGVRSAALGSRVPLKGTSDAGSALVQAIEFEVVGGELEPGTPAPRADFRPVSRAYFDTLGMSLVDGRLFERTDGPTSAKVVVINQAMAERYFPDRAAVGQQIAWADELLSFMGVSLEPRTIVGVVSDSNDYGIGAAVPHIIFQPYEQVQWASVLFVRAAQPASIVRPTLAIIRDVDPDRAVESIATLDEVRADAIAPQRLNATLAGVFALLAVSIAAVGVAGVLAFSVSQRVPELGIRAALGADRARLIRSVLREGVAMTAAGLALGGVVAVALTRLIANLLFEVAPTDPTTFAGVAAVLLAVAIIASWMPARRAAAVDPVTALRADAMRGERSGPRKEAVT